ITFSYKNEPRSNGGLYITKDKFCVPNVITTCLDKYGYCLTLGYVFYFTSPQLKFDSTNTRDHTYYASCIHYINTTAPINSLPLGHVLSDLEMYSLVPQ